MTVAHAGMAAADPRAPTKQRELTEEEQLIIKEKATNEEYKLWKKNTPFLYDVIITKALTWSSLTVEWLPDVEQSASKAYSSHRMVLGTHTSDGLQNYVQIADVHIPNADYDVDGDKYDETTGEAGGYGASGAESKINIVQKIPHEGEVNRARFMPGNQNIIATRTVGGDVLVFDRTKHESMPQADAVCSPEIRLKGHTMEGYGMSWSQTRSGILVTGAYDTTVLEWDVGAYSKTTREMSPVQRYEGHTKCVEDVDFSPLMESVFASVGDDERLLVWDSRAMANGKPTMDVHAHKAEINSVAWSPSEQNLLLTGSADKTIVLWDTRNTKYGLHTFDQHDDEILQVKWSPFSETVFGSSDSRKVNLWDVSKIGEEQDLEDSEDGPPELAFVHGGHCDVVNDFSWNPSEPWMVASVDANTVCQVWQMASSLRFADVPAVDDAFLE